MQKGAGWGAVGGETKRSSAPASGGCRPWLAAQRTRPARHRRALVLPARRAPGELTSPPTPPQHWSVDLWRDFDSSAWLREAAGSADSPTAVRLESFAATLREVFGSAGVLGSAQAAQYWAYHVLRVGFFAVQASLGSVQPAQAGPAGWEAGPTSREAALVAARRRDSVLGGGPRGPAGAALTRLRLPASRYTGGGGAAGDPLRVRV